MRTKTGYRPAHAAAFLALVACAAMLASECVRSNPVMIDEYAHVPAGISFWQLGRHFLYRENPPLVRLLSSFPVWLSRPKMVYANAATTYRSEWNVGRDFIAANGPGHHQYFVRARYVVLGLGIACGLLIFLWASELQGGAAGAVCAALWLLDPTVLAHASIATVDVGTAAFGLLATYFFWKFLHRPGWREAVSAGVGLGLAQACKFSMLALCPAWLALALLARFLPARDEEDAGAAPRASWKRIGAIYLLGLLVLNALYGFDGVGKPLGSYDFKSVFLTGRVVKGWDRAPDGNRVRGAWLSALPVPLPEDYVRGFDSQKWEEEWGFIHLSHGRLFRRGAWYRPLETLLFKLPTGTLAVLAASGLYWIFRSRRLCLAECAALAPALCLMALLATQTGLNWAVRYAVPALPFLCLVAARPVRVAWAHPVWKWGLVTCLAWNAVSVLTVRPHFLSYGNELVGGLEGARREFAGSNFDWGQDLYRLMNWRAEHQDARPMAVLYYGALNPAYLGLNDRGLPDSWLWSGESASSSAEARPRQTFYLAISFNLLIGQPANVHFESGRTMNAFIRCPHLRFENAIAMIGRTIFVFRIVPSSEEKHSRKDITFDELKRCLLEASAEDVARFTLL